MRLLLFKTVGDPGGDNGRDLWVNPKHVAVIEAITPPESTAQKTRLWIADTVVDIWGSFAEVKRELEGW